jgi:hypothetical protein
MPSLDAKPKALSRLSLPDRLPALPDRLEWECGACGAASLLCGDLHRVGNAGRERALCSRCVGATVRPLIP